VSGEDELVIQAANTGSLECAYTVRRGIAAYTESILAVLGDNVLGVCLYGSLARGCYHAASSDVDVIVVVGEEPPLLDVSRVLDVHREAGISIDAVFVTDDQLRADAFPTPVTFLVKPMDGWKTVQVPEGRGDFLLQRQDAFEAGVWLVGPTVADLLRPVPWPLLTESLDYLFPHIIPRFKNPMLMLCRVAYAWTHRGLCSKKRAGEWAKTALGQRWPPALETALAEYADGRTSSSISAGEVRAFEEHCADYVSRMRVAH
jgi:predicted nucleotidyltransferase